MSRPYFGAFLAALLLIAGASVFFFPHGIDPNGDAVGYVDAMPALADPGLLSMENGPRDIFAIHRLLTTSLSIEAVRIFSYLFGSIIVGWLVWDLILFFLISLLWYRLLERLFESARVAFLGGLFFAGNYAMITAGLGNFMDIGGWTFYVLSLSALLSYIHTGKKRDLWLSALAIAIGGLFKENGYVAFVPLAAVLAYESFPSPLRFLKKITPLAALIALPAVIHHWYIYDSYGYYYSYWYRLNQEVYLYPSRLGEYVKSLGSLLTFLAPLSFIGAVLWIRGLLKRITVTDVFIASVLVSSIPALMWPGITQRVLFMVVPGATLLACLLFKKYERYAPVFFALLILYLLGAFCMDSFILPFVNLPF